MFGICFSNFVKLRQSFTGHFSLGIAVWNGWSIFTNAQKTRSMCARVTKIHRKAFFSMFCVPHEREVYKHAARDSREGNNASVVVVDNQCDAIRWITGRHVSDLSENHHVLTKIVRATSRDSPITINFQIIDNVSTAPRNFPDKENERRSPAPRLRKINTSNLLSRFTPVGFSNLFTQFLTFVTEITCLDFPSLYVLSFLFFFFFQH